MSQVPMNLPFEQLASYDKPQLLLTQALDNELTVRGALQTLVDVDGLSPNERDLFTTRLKERVGRNSVTDAAIDVLTNPFVLLMAVTSPVAGQALSRTGRAIFDMSERFSPFVKEQGGLLGSLGFLAPMQLFRGTALTPAVQAFTKGVDEMEKEMLGRVGPALQKVLEKHGLESLNPEKVQGAALKKKAEDLNDLLWASLSGADKKTKQEMWRIRTYDKAGNPFKGTKKERLENGVFRLEKVKTKEQGALVSADIEKMLAQNGLTDLRDAYRGAMDQRRMRLFGNEAESAAKGVFVADEQKLLRMWDGLRMGLSGKGALSGTGAEMAATLMGPELAAQIASGRVPKEDVLKALRQMVEGQDASSYLPRNLIDMKGTSDVARLMEQRRSRALVATGSSLNRISSAGRFDPDDLKRVFGKYGATDEGLKVLKGAERKVQTLIAKGETARVYKINAQESLARHFRDTGVTHSMFVRTTDQMPRLSQAVQDSMRLANPEKLKQLDESFKRTSLMTGGQSLAELFHRQHFLLEDDAAKEALEVMLRGAVGVQKVEHVATHMALIRGKQGLRAVLDSPVGAAMKGAGKWGQGMYDRLDEMANAKLTFGEAKGMSGQLAKYFYVTHLGLNLSSVTMNLMQPLLYASVYGGLGNVMKAYGSAFKEMGEYITERVGKYGVRALSEDEQQGLIRKHFKFSNMEGENLVQIGRDTFSTLDTISFQSDKLGRVGRRESYFFDYPMKMFEKAEWMNRNVAAHAVENIYRGAKIDVKPGSAGYYRMIGDVDEMVSATQFGGNTLNTPLAFQGAGPFGRLANNPLFRQFLSFPLRSVTTLAYDSPRLGGRGVFKGIGQDFLRGMGISAVFYEMGKNTFGVDLSPGLFGASLTQAVGGDRFFQDGNEYVPIPPVVDIPMNLIRGALDPGQRDLIQNNLPRLVPGGIAAARVMGMMPNLMEGPLFGLPGSLQKTYVDFKTKTEDGRVPVYKADGTLIDYQGTGQIFAKALGVDFGTFKQTADFDAFLLKNRDQIVEYRRRAIAALLANEIPKMQGVKQEFKRRFGIELTISKDQLDEAMKNRLVPRTERILERIPPELRGQFQQLAASRAPELGVSAEAIMGADTARQRMQSRQIGTLPLTAEQQAVMAQETGKPFESFGSF
jgi:hypothetical protein